MHVRHACELLETRRLLATVSWVNTVGGSWSVGSNWSTGTVPTPADNVVLDVPGRNISVTYSAAGALVLPNLLNNEYLIIANAAGASWTGGTWEGAGIIDIDTQLSISGSANKILKDGQILNNLGTITLSGTGNIVGRVGATIINAGTFDIRSDADIIFPSGVGDGNFNNSGAGIVLKSIGGTNPGDMTEIGGEQGFTFNNNGDCQILQGTLGLGDLQNVSSSSGTYEISSGAVLDYLRGTHLLPYQVVSSGRDNIPEITGGGTLRISGATVQHYGYFNVHQVDMNAGSFLLNQNMNLPNGLTQRIGTHDNVDAVPDPALQTPFLSFPNATDILNLNGGVFGGNGGGIYSYPSPIREMEMPALVVNTTFAWKGGTLSGSGRLSIEPTVTSSVISTTAAKGIAGAFGLDLLTLTTWQDSGVINMSDGSLIWVHPGVTFWDQGNGFIDGNGEGSGNVWNSGNFLKSGATGKTTIGVGISFINDDNDLALRTSSHPLLERTDPTPTPLDARVDIRTGTLEFLGSSENRDTFLVKPNATLSYAGGTHTVGGRSGNNPSTILGVDGGGTINFGDCNFSADTETLIDVGTTNFGNGVYSFNNPARGGMVIHTGTFGGDPGGAITGSGTLKVTNSLTWNAGRFVGNNIDSLLLIDEGASLIIPSGNRTTLSGYSIENRGTIKWTTSPGTLTVNGNFTQTSTGKFFETALTGATDMDQLQVSGIVTAAGDIVTNLASFRPAVGTVFTLIKNIGTSTTSYVNEFNGLHQGDVIGIGTIVYGVNYAGGDGNDLTLTATAFPAVTIAAPNAAIEGATGTTTNMDFTVSLSQVVAQAVSVNYIANSGTATSGTDFTATSGTLTIPAGSLTGVITVPVIGDNTIESTERYTVVISGAVGGTLGTPATATGVILDDDGPSQIKVEPTTYEVTEGDGTVSVIVTRVNPSTVVSVDYAALSGTAIADSDFSGIIGTLTFPVGVDTLTVDIPIIDDTIFEGSASSVGDENFTLHLSNPVGGGATIVVADATITIHDNDPPALSVSPTTSVVEGNSGTSNLVFTVNVQPSLNTVSVDYQTTDGTAVAGEDYVAQIGTLTFAPGESSKTVTVVVNGDLKVEGDETVFLDILNPVGGQLGATRGTGTIVTDDFPTIGISDATVQESVSGSVDMVFIISLDAPISAPVTFSYATADGTATAGLDYQNTFGTFTLAANQVEKTLRVPVFSDLIAESDETFTLNLSSSTGAAIRIATGNATILDQAPRLVTVTNKAPDKFKDFLGNSISLILKGPGTAVATFVGPDGNDVKTIDITGTTEASTLFIKSNKLQTSVININVDGNIGSITAPKVNLTGALNITGAARNVKLNFLSAGSSVSIGTATTASKSATLSFNRLADATVTSLMPIALFKANSWFDTSNSTIDLTAPSIGTFNIAGDSSADLDIGGTINLLRTGKSLSNAVIRAAGDIKLLSASTISNSLIFAGVSSLISALPTSSADFANNTSHIRKVVVRSTAAAAFSNTVIAAPFVDSVAAGKVNTSNSGTQFGVAAITVGKVTGKIAGKAFSVGKAISVGTPYTSGDFIVEELGLII